ncbi:helix-turn-helix transcriptional regulator [Natronorarus salvus]|uniref:helix-turn-helix transcriptional regulator n=1 Tax=Natronorarus salvus TaxID=3117733 RepID=UPI002F26665B
MASTEHGDDIDVVIDLLRRSPLLEELQGAEYDRREIQDRLGVSRATSHRHTKLLDELGVIERVDGRFRLTESGALLVEACSRFKREASTALQLAPVLEAVKNAPVPIDNGAFAGATVTGAEHGDPHAPLVRFIALVRGTERLHALDLDVVAPARLDEIQGRIVEGMETELIGLPEVARDVIEGYPEKCIEACESGHLTVKLVDEIPFALTIFDDRVGIGVTEPDTRILRLFVDTDADEVHEWAWEVYEAYDAEAIEMEGFGPEGLRRVMETPAFSS